LAYYSAASSPLPPPDKKLVNRFQQLDPTHAIFVTMKSATFQLLEEPLVAQMVKEFLTLYETTVFIGVLADLRY
jgi:hypothetical protein